MVQLRDTAGLLGKVAHIEIELGADEVIDGDRYGLAGRRLLSVAGADSGRGDPKGGKPLQCQVYHRITG